MTRRLRSLFARILLLLFLADIFGLGAVSTFAAIDDQHGPAAESVAADGAHKDGAASSGCNHACHFAQHFFAPVSDTAVAVPHASSHAAPVHRAGPLASIRPKAPYHPPRA